MEVSESVPDKPKKIKVYKFEPCTVKCINDPSQFQKILQKNNVKLSEDSTLKVLQSTLLKLSLSKAFAVINNLFQQGSIKCDENAEYDVERIIDKDYDKEEDKCYYLVKWKDWPYPCSTWEPEENLENCFDEIESFHRSCGTTVSKNSIIEINYAQQSKAQIIGELLDQLDMCMHLDELTPERLFTVLGNQFNNQHDRAKHMIRKRTKTLGRAGPVSKRSKLYSRLRSEALRSLAEWEKKINSVSNNASAGYIKVENTIDIEGPPADFVYVSDYVSGTEVTIPKVAPIGCFCTNDCWESRSSCCSAISGDTDYPYTKYKKLRLPEGMPIYECNSTCKCSSECPFRVVQKGPSVKLSIFRTTNRGWGVKTLQKVPKGVFVMEYVGEVLTYEEAERRGKIYDLEAQTYLFDLDFDGEPEYTVDARHMGNVSHFVNHSCDPNLTIRCVFIDCLDIKLPRIALFARRDIARFEEITFDYNMTGVVTENETLRRHMTPLKTSPTVLTSVSSDAPSTGDANSERSLESSSLAPTEPASITGNVRLSSVGEIPILNFDGEDEENITPSEEHNQPSSNSGVDEPSPSDVSFKEAIMEENILTDNMNKMTSSPSSLTNLQMNKMTSSPSSLTNLQMNKMTSSPTSQNNISSPSKRKSTELTPQTPTRPVKSRMKCLCKAKNCRGFLY